MKEPVWLVTITRPSKVEAHDVQQQAVEYQLRKWIEKTANGCVYARASPFSADCPSQCLGKSSDGNECRECNSIGSLLSLLLKIRLSAFHENRASTRAECLQLDALCRGHLQRSLTEALLRVR